MTHVIKAPKPPRRGPTFGDVPLGGLFLRRGYRARLAKVDPDEHGGFNAVSVAGVARKKMKDDDPVTLLSVQPVTPEPDPDVCTYPESEPGCFYRWAGEESLFFRTDEGHAYVDRGEYSPPAAAGNEVRRAHVTIVEHEEPGTALTQCLGGSIRVTREQLAAIVRQGAAFLAQQATSPESGEPYSMTTEQGRAVHQALADSVELGDFVGMAPPAEDRSKPAPGWSRPFEIHGYGEALGHVAGADWCILPPKGDARVRFTTEAEAIAYSWAQHDAATKGGES